MVFAFALRPSVANWILGEKDYFKNSDLVKNVNHHMPQWEVNFQASIIRCVVDATPQLSLFLQRFDETGLFMFF